MTRQRDPCFYYNPIQREFLHISHARTIPWPQHTITHVYSTQGNMAMMKVAINRKVVGYSPHWEHTARSTQQRRRKNSSENLGSWEGTWGGGDTRGVVGCWDIISRQPVSLELLLLLTLLFLSLYSLLLFVFGSAYR